MKPLQQGELDGLCGFYSIMNALRLIHGGITEDKCYEHTMDWLTALEKKRGNLAKIVATGLYIREMVFILNRASKQYDLKRSRPYHNKAKVGIDDFWSSMVAFFKAGHHRAIIIGYYSNLWDDDGHWSVVRRVTNRSIHLFDSYSGKYLLRSDCTTDDEDREKEIVIYPPQTFFLMKNGG